VNNHNGSVPCRNTAGGIEHIPSKHDKGTEMKTKYMAGVALAFGLIVGGTALAFNLNTKTVQADEATTATPTTVETDNCCLTGDCCCPGQGACCDLAVKAKAAASGVKYVKKAGAGCCATGNCCCPGAGSCCAASATAKDDAKSCCSKAEKKESCCSK